MSRQKLSGTASVVALSLLAAPAAAEPKDKEASALAKQAMDTDYLGTRFKDAEQKLNRALKTCAHNRCSAAVRAQLHLDLAVVYLAGLKKKDKAKKEMKAAIAADSSVRLSSDFTTPEVEKAFIAAGGVKQEAAAAAPEDADADADERAESAPPTEPAGEAEASNDEVPRNWFSLTFQQDLLTYSKTSRVCDQAAQYQCFLQGRSYSAPIYAGSGNELQGGVGFATRRVLLGYERLLGDNITAGVRLGFAFSGSPKATNGRGTAFLPVHAELRGSYWFGDAPFKSDGLRGYVGLAAGLGEVDGHVTVEYFESLEGYQNGAKGKLDAWRKTGNLFVGLHGGFAYGFAKRQQLLLELRLLQMLGESALGGAVSLGYGFGL